MTSDAVGAVELSPGYVPDADDAEVLDGEWFDSLPPHRQVDVLNDCSDYMGSSTNHVVVAGEVVSEGGLLHRQAVARETALRWRRSRLAGLVRPPLRVRPQGRAPRSRRTTPRRTPARSPDREPEPPPARPLDLGALA
jgi:hypothetical protein